MMIYWHLLKMICDKWFSGHYARTDGDGMRYCGRCEVSLNDEHKSLGWLNYNYFPYVED